jgi:hypothetical protein
MTLNVQAQEQEKALARKKKFVRLIAGLGALGVALQIQTRIISTKD